MWWAAGMECIRRSQGVVPGLSVCKGSWCKGQWCKEGVAPGLGVWRVGAGLLPAFSRTH